MLNDVEFNLQKRLRRSLRIALVQYTKEGKIMPSKQYGIDYKAIVEHLKPFPKDLSLYDIHHKRLLASFKFTNPDGSTNLEEVKKAFAPENHKLLKREEHRKINHKKLHRQYSKIKVKGGKK